MARETGKQRSQRIQIDHFRRGGGLQQLRYVCIFSALAAAGVYAAYVLGSGGGSHTSTGPVARAHAAFESDCNACHKDFVPIDSQAVKIDLASFGISSKESIAHLETTCKSCHDVGDHYRELMNEEGVVMDQNCGLCHAEHKGRDNDLTLVANRQCVTCHENLSTVCTGSPTVTASVTSFTKEAHGDFASLQDADPGVIKFDHAQHMLPGQVNAGEKGAFTIGMLEESLKERYRMEGQDDSSPIQLDCFSCHEFDGNPAGVDSLSFDNELGRYIAPISFDSHCAACHSMNPPAATEDTAPLPHAESWEKIRLLVKGSLVGARASGQARTPRDDTQATPQPGEGTGRAAPAGSVREDIEARADELVDLVKEECRKCHDEDSITEEAIANAPYADPLIPPRWFQHGLYDHGIHREIDCKYCHAAAYADATDGTAKPPTDHETVMIAGIDTCTGCHRDADTPTPASITDPQVALLLRGQTTWASDACIFCHRYHTRRDRAALDKATDALAEAQP